MRNLVKFEWRFPEDDEWKTLAVSSALTKPVRRAQRISYILVGIALLAIVVWLVARPQASEQPADVSILQQEIEQTIASESRQGHKDGANADAAPLVQIQEIELDDNWAVVEVIVTQTQPSGLGSLAIGQAVWLLPVMVTPTQQAGVPAVYRVSRFYQQTQQGWQPAIPPADFWGRQHTLETAHLQVIFHERDQATVIRVTAESEALFAGLCRMVGLQPAPDEKLTIEITPRAVVEGWSTSREYAALVVTPRALAAGWLTTERGIQITSPLLLRISADLSRSTVLGQTIRAALVSHIVQQVAQQRPARWQWQSLVAALHRWLLQTDTLPFPLSSSLNETTRAPSLSGDLPKLTDLQFRLELGWLDSANQEMQIVAAQTLIDHIASTYGEELLALFLQALSQHDDWSTLIPVVFKVSVVEFETDWRTSLAKRNR